MNDVELVSQFIEKMVAHDADGAVAFMSDDVFVHNIPIEPTRSKEEWKQRMVAYDFSEGFKIEMVNIASDGNGNVLTERVDSFMRRGAWIDIPIMGAFTIKDGLIVSWREYFDLATAKAIIA